MVRKGCLKGECRFLESMRDLGEIKIHRFTVGPGI
jgi:hypothetical protein